MSYIGAPPSSMISDPGANSPMGPSPGGSSLGPSIGPSFSPSLSPSLSPSFSPSFSQPARVSLPPKLSPTTLVKVVDVKNATRAPIIKSVPQTPKKMKGSSSSPSGFKAKGSSSASAATDDDEHEKGDLPKSSSFSTPATTPTSTPATSTSPTPSSGLPATASTFLTNISTTPLSVTPTRMFDDAEPSGDSVATVQKPPSGGMMLWIAGAAILGGAWWLSRR